MNRKFLLSTGILILSVICTASLSKYVALLSIMLIIIAFLKRILFPINKEFVWFILIGIGGAVVEIILVNLSNAWSYSNPQLLGIPIWIPLFWGIIGTTIVVAYDGFIESS